jgi:hypothetical protein
MSEGFTPTWLDLREPADAKACNPVLTRRLIEWAAARKELRVVDLGAGTGVSLRRLSPRLPPHQRWTLIERERALIEAGRERLGAGTAPHRYRRLDLATDLEAVGEDGADLITASALIDLVGSTWLQRLVRLRARLGAALYVVLSYDGRVLWQPPDEADAACTALVNRHQRGEKGFGPALGPEAALVLHRLLGPYPGELLLGRSDWRLGSGEVPLQEALLRGHVEAASAVAPEAAPEAVAWGARRRAALAAPGAGVQVGHLDLLFLPPTDRD